MLDWCVYIYYICVCVDIYIYNIYIYHHHHDLASPDIPDPLSPLLPIVHRLW